MDAVSLEGKTAIPGAEPGAGQKPASPADNKEGAKPDSPPVTDVDLGDDGKPLPFNEHPKWKSARQAEKRLQDILKANDLDGVEDLLELVDSGKAVKGKLADTSMIDELIAKAGKLDQYEAYWREQEEQRRRQGENPEDTIKRLEAENKAKDKAMKDRDSEKKDREEAQKAIDGFDRDIKAIIKEAALPPAQAEFALLYLGVNNPFNEIDITDKKAVRKHGADGLKKVMGFIEAIKSAAIQDYIDGKAKLPKTGGGATDNAPVDRDKVNERLKTSAGRKQAMTEAFSKIFGGSS
jgi:hypothetical protein